MSGFKGIAKGGWHPKGDKGGKESWRGDFKGVNTVAGWMGKGKDPDAEARESHVSAPLSTLKDPASFGPPPKHINYHGAAASPSAPTPDRRGLGAPLTQEESTAKQRLQARREAEARAEEEANRSPPGPYKVNTTGLSTANLPKPPVRRLEQDAASPSVGQRAGPPRLPPRLPPRQNSHPDAYSQPGPPPYSETSEDNVPSGALNQGALNRLAQAGVSVPGLNVGRDVSPPVPLRQTPPPAQTSPSSAGPQSPQLGELQSRFAKMRTSSPEDQAPPSGTSWAEKQAAIRTASNLRDDPSKVSAGDLRGAAATANNFRQRHGEQVAAGWQKANNLNQKYGLTDRVSSYASSASPASPAPPQSPTSSGIGKKPPPPPPKKKGLAAATGDEPPPIPLSSKPKF